MVKGYSHALFQISNPLRKVALDVDTKENGGNNNGLIDGDEIQKFKDRIKSIYNYDFNFDDLESIKIKEIKVRDRNTREPYYNTTTEIAQAFGGATTTKTIDWLNDKQPGKDLLSYSTINIKIPFMENYDKNAENVELQGKQATEAKEAKEAEEKKLDNAYAEKHWFRAWIGIPRIKFEKTNKRDY